MVMDELSFLRLKLNDIISNTNQSGADAVICLFLWILMVVFIKFMEN